MLSMMWRGELHWLSGQCVDMVILKTWVQVPPQDVDNFQPSSSGRILPTCSPYIQSTFTYATSVKRSTGGQHGPSKPLKIKYGHTTNGLGRPPGPKREPTSAMAPSGRKICQQHPSHYIASFRARLQSWAMIFQYGIWQD